MIKAIYFDCDGTILNTLEDIHEALNKTLKHVHRPMVTLEQTKTYVGNGLKKLMKNALGKDEVDEELALFHHYYSQDLMVFSHPYEGIVAFLKELKSSGFKLGMISNKTDAYIQRIAQHYFTDLFDVVVGERDDLQRKPHHDMLDYACEHTGVVREEVIFIGDSVVDAQFIINHQLQGGVMLYGFEDRNALLHTGLACFEDVSELRRWILSKTTV